MRCREEKDLLVGVAGRWCSQICPHPNTHLSAHWARLPLSMGTLTVHGNRKNSTELVPRDHLVSITHGVAQGQWRDHMVLIPEPRFFICEVRMMAVSTSWGSVGGLYPSIPIKPYDQ